MGYEMPGVRRSQCFRPTIVQLGRFPRRAGLHRLPSLRDQDRSVELFEGIEEAFEVRGVDPRKNIGIRGGDRRAMRERGQPVDQDVVDFMLVEHTQDALGIESADVAADNESSRLHGPRRRDRRASARKRLIESF